MPDSLQGWLAYIEQQHSQTIALGLDRVLAVSHALGQQKTCPVVMVAGTNGKGSVCAMLESVFLCAGYRVGLYTSPHFLDYNERVRINGVPCSDEKLCHAFARVEVARAALEDTSLTYFEFGTLAAWEVFSAEALDVIVLEIGLGGRLDAVNAFEPDCSVVTGIDLDHLDFLGTDREQIGFEKAGIFRTAKAAICGDINPPKTLLDHAKKIGAGLKVSGQDFGFMKQEQQWQYWSWQGKRSGLAHPALRGSMQLFNASTVLAALDALRDLLPVAMQDVRRGLMEVELPGRFQLLPGRPAVVLDVAHNPQAAAILSENLSNMAYHPETWAVFGMLADKDIAAVIRAMKKRVTHWLVCTLPGPRSATASALNEMLQAEGVTSIIEFLSPSKAFEYAGERAKEDDRIVAFGSFLTVADVMRSLALQSDRHV